MLRSLISFIFLMLCTSMALAGAPQTGDIFPEEPIKTPADKRACNYLGINPDDPQFSVSDIKAELVIVEIFSMYCPHCQREAPFVNDLYNLIGEEDLQNRVKMIGIAPGNSDFEISIFKDKYDVLFPLFSDKDYKWHELLGKVGTPYFFGLVPGKDKAIVALGHQGKFDTPRNFLNQLLKAAKKINP